MLPNKCFEGNAPPANLYGAEWYGVNLSGANLSNAVLIETKFGGANMGTAVLSGARWGNTQCPDQTWSNENGTKPESCEGHLTPLP